MLDLLVTNFPNFQDHILDKQQYFYKRPQILIADLYAAFKEKDRVLFNDIHELTTFPDYRVPQILLEDGMIEYSEELKHVIQSGKVI